MTKICRVDVNIVHVDETAVMGLQFNILWKYSIICESLLKIQ